MVMSTKIIDMFREDQTCIQLIEILKLLPENSESKWSFFHFDGSGTPPDNLSMEEFEKLTLKSDKGYEISWEKLIDFASNLNQTIDCVLVSFRQTDKPCREDINNGKYGSCELVIKAEDSTSWIISGTHDQLLQNLNVLKSN